MKILVVEDDEAQLLWLKKRLTEAGHDVRAAHDDDWALRMWRSFGPLDVVVTDYRYPGKTIRNGLDLIAAIRSIDPLQAFVMQTSERNLTPPFGVPMLQKPYQIHRLLKLLKPSAQRMLPYGV
jgi:two-component system, OmpR family, response regulator VicR